MAAFKKRVMAPGTYQTPDGLADVTPARIKHWHETVQAMLLRGYRPPLSWGHVSKAVPATDDDRAYWSSRFIAGQVTGSHLDPMTGEWYLEGDAPGAEQDAAGRLVSEATLPDGRKVKTAHDEVSVGATDWTDGDGRVWKDAPIHLALTPLPVWVPEGGQPPFEAPDLPPQQRFSTAQLFQRFATEPPMADEPKKDDGPPKKKDEGGGKGGTPEAGGGDLKKALKMLATCGITLPDDTTAENLVERLIVACTAKEGDMGGAGGGEPPPPPTEEPAGAFLSTVDVKDPVTRALMVEKEQGDRQKRLERVAGLERRGLRPPEAKRLREEITKVRFAVARDGTIRPASVDGELGLLERVLPPEGQHFGHDALLRSLASAHQEPPPEGELDDVKKNQKVADLVAKSAGLGPAHRV